MHKGFVLAAVLCSWLGFAQTVFSAAAESGSPSWERTRLGVVLAGTNRDATFNWCAFDSAGRLTGDIEVLRESVVELYPALFSSVVKEPGRTAFYDASLLRVLDVLFDQQDRVMSPNDAVAFFRRDVARVKRALDIAFKKRLLCQLVTSCQDGSDPYAVENVTRYIDGSNLDILDKVKIIHHVGLRLLVDHCEALTDVQIAAILCPETLGWLDRSRAAIERNVRWTTGFVKRHPGKVTTAVLGTAAVLYQYNRRRKIARALHGKFSEVRVPVVPRPFAHYTANDIAYACMIHNKAAALAAVRLKNIQVSPELKDFEQAVRENPSRGYTVGSANAGGKGLSTTIDRAYRLHQACRTAQSVQELSSLSGCAPVTVNVVLSLLSRFGGPDTQPTVAPDTQAPAMLGVNTLTRRMVVYGFYWHKSQQVDQSEFSNNDSEAIDALYQKLYHHLTGVGAAPLSRAEETILKYLETVSGNREMHSNAVMSMEEVPQIETDFENYLYAHPDDTELLARAEEAQDGSVQTVIQGIFADKKKMNRTPSAAELVVLGSRHNSGETYGWRTRNFGGADRRKNKAAAILSKVAAPMVLRAQKSQGVVLEALEAWSDGLFDRNAETNTLESVASDIVTNLRCVSMENLKALQRMLRRKTDNENGPTFAQVLSATALTEAAVEEAIQTAHRVFAGETGKQKQKKGSASSHTQSVLEDNVSRSMPPSLSRDDVLSAMDALDRWHASEDTATTLGGRVASKGVPGKSLKAKCDFIVAKRKLLDALDDASIDSLCAVVEPRAQAFAGTDLAVAIVTSERARRRAAAISTEHAISQWATRNNLSSITQDNFQGIETAELKKLKTILFSGKRSGLMSRIKKPDAEQLVTEVESAMKKGYAARQEAAAQVLRGMYSSSLNEDDEFAVVVHWVKNNAIPHADAHELGQLGTVVANHEAVLAHDLSTAIAERRVQLNAPSLQQHSNGSEKEDQDEDSGDHGSSSRMLSKSRSFGDLFQSASNLFSRGAALAGGSGAASSALSGSSPASSSYATPVEESTVEERERPDGPAASAAQPAVDNKSNAEGDTSVGGFGTASDSVSLVPSELPEPHASTGQHQASSSAVSAADASGSSFDHDADGEDDEEEFEETHTSLQHDDESTTTHVEDDTGDDAAEAAIDAALDKATYPATLTSVVEIMERSLDLQQRYAKAEQESKRKAIVLQVIKDNKIDVSLDDVKVLNSLSGKKARATWNSRFRPSRRQEKAAEYIARTLKASHFTTSSNSAGNAGSSSSAVTTAERPRSSSAEPHEHE